MEKILDLFDNIQTGLSPIIKWPGGKEKELKYIIPTLPNFKRYFEPFVGGGSVFMAINKEEFFINDYSFELISLYRNIASSDSLFFYYVEQIDKSWDKSLSFFNGNKVLIDTYLRFREEKISENELNNFVENFCIANGNDILDIIGEFFSKLPCILISEMKKNIFRKMVRMRELEKEKHLLSDADLKDNIETAIKSAVYMNYRYLFNKRSELGNETMHCALFFFIRNYAYSGMFRYSSSGEFNVPYGGIAYNSKLMKKKLDYYKSEQFINHIKKAKIYNLDFEVFLKETNPSKDDFVFLDPPYDTEFSTYAQNTFSKDDQIRLANYMINECPAKWMLIIKNTDFIFNLYNKDGIKIRTFDKEYMVSFMNRNDKKVTHLLITNY